MELKQQKLGNNDTCPKFLHLGNQESVEKMDRPNSRRRERVADESANEGVKAGFPLVLSLIQYLLFRWAAKGKKQDGQLQLRGVCYGGSGRSTTALWNQRHKRLPSFFYRPSNERKSTGRARKIIDSTKLFSRCSLKFNLDYGKRGINNKETFFCRNFENITKIQISRPNYTAYPNTTNDSVHYLLTHSATQQIS